MGFDVKGVAKDNQKLLLSVLGILALAMFMGVAGSKEGGFFGVWDFGTMKGSNTATSTSTNNVESTAPNTISANAPAPVNNGRNGVYKNEPDFNLDENADYKAVIYTNQGNIEVDLYESLTPNTVNNFVTFAEDGYYNKTSFHRVIKDYIIQGGDPLGTGLGGPGFNYANEIVNTLRFKPFTLAMANVEGQRNSNGSQFFITTRFSNTSALDGSYTIFGQVTGGYDVVDKIELAKVEETSKRPTKPIIIEKIDIVKE